LRLKVQIKEAESEIDAYTNCLAQLQSEEKDEALSETQFAVEMAKVHSPLTQTPLPAPPPPPHTLVLTRILPPLANSAANEEH
jgi:hypothetical protein